LPGFALPGPLDCKVCLQPHWGHNWKKNGPHVMKLWKYKPLNQDDALWP
jgi:hypothetical protein